MNLRAIFSEVPDFRIAKKVKHYLHEILIISLCAVLSGAEDCEEIEEYGKQKEEFLRQFLELPNGIPSHDTFNRIFRFMDCKAFNKCLCKWSGEIVRHLKDRYQINIDGKVLRATGKKGKKTAALCLVSAWVAEQHLSLGQVKVEKKSNEKTAIPLLLDELELNNALVSIDAMGCDKSTAKKIESKGGKYLLALKKNQKALYEEVHDWMAKHLEHCDKDEAITLTGGRIERRTAYVTANLDYIDELQKWEACKSIIMIRSERTNKNTPDKTTTSTRFYISSATGTAEFFNSCTRHHWSIENNLHWQLDVVFSEDRQRIRKDNGADNFATLRKMALQLLLNNKGKSSLKKARKRAAWNQNFLIQVLSSIPNLISCV